MIRLSSSFPRWNRRGGKRVSSSGPLRTAEEWGLACLPDCKKGERAGAESVLGRLVVLAMLCELGVGVSALSAVRC